MPANLTAQYLKAEAAYRSAQSLDEELECLQVMLREIPKHKGTDKLQADLKGKIAKLKTEALEKKPSSGKPINRIPKQGAGRVLLVGAPNVGKSQLLASLTRAKPEIAPYPFTTQTPQPGMMAFEDCPIQLIDMPPMTADYFDADLLGLIRGADIVLLVIDLASDALVEETQAVLDHFQGKTRLGRASCLDEEDIGTTYTQTLVVLNKCDAPSAKERLAIFDEFIQLDLERLEVSGLEKTGLDRLTEEVFKGLNVVRVYTKNPKMKEPDMSRPFTIRQGETLIEVAELIHKDVAANLKGARVWGIDVHPGTNVKPDYQPKDKDIVELNSGT